MIKRQYIESSKGNNFRKSVSLEGKLSEVKVSCISLHYDQKEKQKAQTVTLQHCAVR